MSSPKVESRAWRIQGSACDFTHRTGSNTSCSGATRTEPLTLSFLSANLRAGDTAVLAGVNFGQHAVVAALAVGPSGRVVGVEPQPRALLKTWDALKANGVEQRATLVATALGSLDGLSPMAWSDPANAGAASLLNAGSGLYVPVLRLPQILQALEIAVVRLMLLDVEGFESHVLTGMAGGPLPDIIVVEIVDQFVARAGSTPEDLLRQIQELGYRLYALDGSVVTTSTATLPEQNVVGIRNSVSARWSVRASAERANTLGDPSETARTLHG